MRERETGVRLFRETLFTERAFDGVHCMNLKQYIAAGTALEQRHKVEPRRIPWHIWRDAFIAGEPIERAVARAQAHDYNNTRMKVRRNRGRLAGSP